MSALELVLLALCLVFVAIGLTPLLSIATLGLLFLTWRVGLHFRAILATGAFFIVTLALSFLWIRAGAVNVPGFSTVRMLLCFAWLYYLVGERLSLSPIKLRKVVLLCLGFLAAAIVVQSLLQYVGVYINMPEALLGHKGGGTLVDSEQVEFLRSVGVFHYRPSLFYTEPSYFGLIILSLFTVAVALVRSAKDIVFAVVPFAVAAIVSGSAYLVVSGTVIFLLAAVLRRKAVAGFVWWAVAVLAIAGVIALLGSVVPIGDRQASLFSAHDLSRSIRLIQPWHYIESIWFHVSPLGYPTTQVQAKLLSLGLVATGTSAPLDNGLLNILMDFGVAGILLLAALRLRTKGWLPFAYVVLALMQNGAYGNWDKAFIIGLTCVLLNSLGTKGFLSKKSSAEVKGHGRVFYLSPNVFDNYKRRHGEELIPFPGANKVTGVARALQAVGVHCWTVSSPVVTRGRKRCYRPLVLRSDHHNSVYLWGFRNRWLNRSFALLTYGWFCATRVKRTDRVIFYNPNLEYALAALVLKLRRNPGILDIEDGVRETSQGIRDSLAGLAFHLLSPLCAPRCLVAGESIGEQFGRGRRVFVCHGVSQALEPARRDFGRLTVLYAGNKTVEWGTELFADMFRFLAQQPSSIRSRIRFLVTGFGDFAQIDRVKEEYGSLVDIRVLPETTTAEYQDLLASSNVGLELRIPGSEGAETTFPSKLIELGSHGILILTTGTGDVRSVYDSRSALILEEASGEALAAALVSILNRPSEASDRALEGARITQALHSPAATGEGLRAFLFPKPVS